MTNSREAVRLCARHHDLLARRFGIRHSTFFRHSCSVIRHFPALWPHQIPRCPHILPAFCPIRLQSIFRKKILLKFGVRFLWGNYIRVLHMASLRWMLTIAVLASISAAGRAAPPQVSMTDVLQTMQACQKLQEDELLAPLNVGVRVRGRVAVLWGPIPTAELALRAEQRLRQMIDLIGVRNELIVMPEDLRDVRVPQAPPPFFLPEAPPPPLPEPPLRLMRLGFEGPSNNVSFHASAAS